MTTATEPKLFSIERLAERWDLSKWSVRRLIVQGELKSVTIGARRLIPLSEVERAEQYGVGRGKWVKRYHSPQGSLSG